MANNNLTNDHRKPAQEIFERIVSQTPNEQNTYLDTHCDDPAIRTEVEKLLEYHDLDIPALDETQTIEADPTTQSLWKEADEIWEAFQNRREFRAYVSADYAEIYQALVRLRGRVTSVLEWGSGLGVVTIMASNLGFEAYGIESEPRLVDWSRKLAEEYGPAAQFVTGSFIPREYEWDPHRTLSIDWGE